MVHQLFIILSVAGNRLHCSLSVGKVRLVEAMVKALVEAMVKALVGVMARVRVLSIYLLV
jgi:hypothetical protein